MFTSNFRKYANDPNAVSISGRSPHWYKGVEYKKLAPKYWFFMQYKDPDSVYYKDEEFYTLKYFEEVLAPLDPHEVYSELNENSILLCYEKSGDFCHRRLVAKWFEEHLDIEVPEL